ncbi:hypothetical protein LTR78_002344 [Recurvomyces mirabilis]|uniref:F-box domain-containing protein n=1 Tax=Recurvomyces mirabilis TaxID=574656 RepID=A0AAE0WT21_9PEZI|nr:hypothetical protein LTR78_002344 [Recurvomyces mirabilis]KAK5157273.1 hypothetical protein LTS14_004038 [Recurvomyces mirabilis]
MPHIPDEIWLQIIDYVPAADLWNNMRLASKQLLRCVEDYVSKAPGMLEDFTIGLAFSLAAGPHHRWYDVRGTITFSFVALNKHNHDYARFARCLVHPQRMFDRGIEQWRRISSGGPGERQDWRLQHSIDSTKLVKLRKVIADADGVYCDWRELFDAYYKQQQRDVYGRIIA